MNQKDITQIVNALKPVFATKDDLKAFATKDDLKAFATKDDFKKLEAKQDNMDIKLDAFLGQILDAREAQEIQQATITDHSDDIEKHEQRIKVVEHRLKSSPTPVSSLT